MVSGGAQRDKRLRVLAFGAQRPGGGDLRLDLGLLSPLGEIPFGERLL
jgi:hypothetical protein